MLLLKVKENSEAAKTFIEFAKNMPFIEVVGNDLKAQGKIVVKNKKPNLATLKAISDADAGKTVEVKSFKDLMKKIAG